MKFKPFHIREGDVFCTSFSGTVIAKAINAVQKFWAKDFSSEYSHSGIFVSKCGQTFEALWTYKSQDFFKAYEGSKVIVARPLISMKAKYAIRNLMDEYQGKLYPLWRLPMHTFPPLSRIHLMDRPVCSELTALYLHRIGVRDYPPYGTNPDTLADEWRKWRDYQIIFEGVL